MPKEELREGWIPLRPSMPTDATPVAASTSIHTHASLSPHSRVQAKRSASSATPFCNPPRASCQTWTAGPATSASTAPACTSGSAPAASPPALTARAPGRAARGQECRCAIPWHGVSAGCVQVVTAPGTSGEEGLARPGLWPWAASKADSANACMAAGPPKHRPHGPLWRICVRTRAPALAIAMRSMQCCARNSRLHFDKIPGLFDCRVTGLAWRRTRRRFHRLAPPARAIV